VSEPNLEAVSVLDAFSNPLFRLGYGSQSPLEATEYPLTRMTGNYALLNSLYRENWVVQNVVGIIPDDMTRKWFTVTGAVSPEHLRELDRVQSAAALRESVNEGLRWGRLYGGAAGLIMLRGQEGFLDHPLDLKSILPGTFRGLYILDRWCGIAPEPGLVYDGRGRMVPAYYTITGEDGRTAARVHHSRVVRFTGRELPYLERIAELYWGESEVEALYQDVVKHDNVAANMAALTFRANVDTMEVQNLDQLFSLASGEMQRRFWAPKADEVAKIAREKSEAILAAFQAGLLGVDTAQKELKKLAGETGLFDSITDEEIAANRGKTYQDVTAMADPFAGLAPPASFEAPTGDSLTTDFNPHHDPSSGRFTSGGGSGKIGGTKYAPSPQRSHEGIQLKPKKYAKLCGTLNTRFPGLKAGEVRRIFDAKRVYTVKADGYGGMQVMSVKKIK